MHWRLAHINNNRPFYSTSTQPETHLSTQSIQWQFWHMTKSQVTYLTLLKKSRIEKNFWVRTWNKLTGIPCPKRRTISFLGNLRSSLFSWLLICWIQNASIYSSTCWETLRPIFLKPKPWPYLFCITGIMRSSKRSFRTSTSDKWQVG